MQVVLEWPPLGVSTSQSHTPIRYEPRRLEFEGVEAAAGYAVKNLSARDLPEIKTTDGGIILSGWDLIANWLREREALAW
jgi:hypothetical protein